MTLGSGCAVGHEHDLLNARDLPGQGFQQADERLIHEEDLVLRVVDDEFQVLGEKAQVQGVQDGAHAGHRVIELQMAVVVEGQRGHPVPGLDPEALERARQAVDARHEVRVRHPMDALLAFGHDLGLSVQALQPPEHVLQAQLIVLHQAFHYRHLHQLAVGRALYPSEGRW